MRILGFMLMCSLGIANMALKRRIPPKKISGGIFNFKAFKSPAFAIYCFSALVAYLGMYTRRHNFITKLKINLIDGTVLTFIDISAISVGISPEFSFFLVAIVNAGSGAGRLFTAFLLDRFGKCAC